MAILIACLGQGQGTWSSVFKLANMPDWEKVIFIGPQFAKDTLQLKENMQFITIEEKDVKKMTEDILAKIGNLFGEVGVSLYSGSGALHMATLAAVLKAGGGIKLVHYEDGLIEL